MNTKITRILRTIVTHMVFWIGVWFLYYYFFSYNSNDREYVTWFSSLLMPVTIAVTYAVSLYLIPQLLLQKKYGRFILYSFYLLLASSYMIVLIIYGSLIFIKKWDASSIPPMVKNFFFILILIYIVAGIVGFVTILNLNFKAERKNRELQNKFLEAELQMKDQELNYLKMQIHPHFLFNTLNTIYGLALKNSKSTPDVILRLSNLLDYILYQVNKTSVPLSEEVEHIREYIELERIRFKETLNVTFKTDEIDPDIRIAPMLIIPFVENAFKHGSIVNDFIEVDILIRLSKGTLYFEVSNSFNPETVQETINGIGLENLRKRLELHYPKQYSLEILPDDMYYRVKLEINGLNRK